jgi:taurine-pyruvate aminotransferase
LLIGVELVKDRATKEQADPATVAAVVDYCKSQGVIVGRSGGGRRHSNTIVFSPPLVITRAECDRLVETLDRALTSLPA